eukprot:m.50147 g.50147  ORF g.50147 m.50147 type:complete len:103 (-) comp7495_c0_seq2:667-975(-)
MLNVVVAWSKEKKMSKKAMKQNEYGRKKYNYKIYYSFTYTQMRCLSSHHRRLRLYRILSCPYASFLGEFHLHVHRSIQEDCFEDCSSARILLAVKHHILPNG